MDIEHVIFYNADASTRDEEYFHHLNFYLLTGLFFIILHSIFVVC